MKKILTLMVMFAMTAGILSTQAQTLSYQVVVRDVNNNLVVNQELTVNVTIFSPETDGYQQVITAKTNHNGMLSLTIGEDLHGEMPADGPEALPFSRIDWVHARISLDFTNNNIEDIVEEDVFAVPYALQASFLLTTDAIVDYLEAAQPSDWNQVYAALKDNKPFLNAIRDTVVEYVKANYAIAKGIALHYLSQMTAQDVTDAYNAVNAALENPQNPELRSALNDVIMDYVQKHRELAYEVARYYAQHATAAGVERLYDAAMAKQDVIDPIMDSVLLVFLKEYGLDPACMTNYNYTFCELLDAAANLGNMGVCTEIAKVQNTVGDGLYALYENQGVIYTAYVKNFRNNLVVTEFGFKQANKTTPNDFVTIPLQQGDYQAITKQFGKFTYLMNNTATCGDTLLVKAYMKLAADSIPAGCASELTIESSVMEVAVPTFEIAIVQDGNTVKATFTPSVAQDAFNVKKDNVNWIINGQTSEVTGLTFELVPGTTYTSIKATAHLGDCSKVSNELKDVIAQ